MKLYELTQNYANILNLLDREDIESEMLVQALNSIEDDISIKIENTVKLIKGIESDVAAFKEEEKRLADKRKSRENTVKNLKIYIEDSLNKINKDKLKCNLFTVALQNNKKTVDISNLNLLDRKYLIEQDPVADKKLILEDIKLGVDVQGVELKQTRSLRIR